MISVTAVSLLMGLHAGPVCAAPAGHPAPARPAANSVTISGSSAVSTSAMQVSCLVPGRLCSMAELERELASVRAEMDRMSRELQKEGTVKKPPTPGDNRKPADLIHRNLQMRYMGFRRVECRLRTIRDKARKSSTEFVVPTAGPAPRR